MTWGDFRQSQLDMLRSECDWIEKEIAADIAFPEEIELLLKKQALYERKRLLCLIRRRKPDDHHWHEAQHCAAQAESAAHELRDAIQRNWYELYRQVEVARLESEMRLQVTLAELTVCVSMAERSNADES